MHIFLCFHHVSSTLLRHARGYKLPTCKKVVLISDSDFWYTMSIFILPFLKNGYKVKSKVLVSPFTHSHLPMLTHHKNINTDVELKKKKNQV
jgi:hypothetical protein